MRWARAVDGVIVEDDYDAEFRYDRRPVAALRALAPDRVALLGSLSKTLAPGFGVGWLVPPDDVPAARAGLDVDASAPPSLHQLTCAALLADGGYDRHLRSARARYRRRRAALLAALERRLPGLPVTGLAAGLHVVLGLPPGRRRGPRGPAGRPARRARGAGGPLPRRDRGLGPRRSSSGTGTWSTRGWTRRSRVWPAPSGRQPSPRTNRGCPARARNRRPRVTLGRWSTALPFPRTPRGSACWCPRRCHGHGYPARARPRRPPGAARPRRRARGAGWRGRPPPWAPTSSCAGRRGRAGSVAAHLGRVGGGCAWRRTASRGRSGLVRPRPPRGPPCRRRHVARHPARPARDRRPVRLGPRRRARGGRGGADRSGP